MTTCVAWTILTTGRLKPGKEPEKVSVKATLGVDDGDDDVDESLCIHVERDVGGHYLFIY